MIRLIQADNPKFYELYPRICRIICFEDAAILPSQFAIAPAKAINKILKATNLAIADIDLIELNEAYAAVVLANQQILGLDLNKTNLYGGAIAMGHPLGASGARILCTLAHMLKKQNGKYGIAAICNGGGAASAILIERFDEGNTYENK